MPLAAPVMTATFPSSLPGMVILRCYVSSLEPASGAGGDEDVLDLCERLEGVRPELASEAGRLKPPKGVQ